MAQNSDIDIINQAKSAAALLMRHYRHGSYRIIRDPEGVISLWAIEGSPNAPFTISFVDKGRVHYRIDEVPEYFLKSFIEYVGKSFR